MIVTVMIIMTEFVPRVNNKVMNDRHGYDY